MSEDAENPQAEKAQAPEVDDTPLGALFKAVDQADQIKRVLIIFERNDGTFSSEDNGILTSDAIYMARCYEHWVLTNIFRPKDC